MWFTILFSMKKSSYFLASLFGFVPSFFVTNTIGAGLNSYVEQAQNFSIVDLILTPQIYLPISAFVGLLILSLLIKKKFFNGSK